MSNLTPQDVDVRLTATRNELVEEDLRLWEGLEDEKISRIAGDEANKQLINLVVDANQDTENRLSTEVLHRSEGDLSNVSSLTALAQALSQYRIKTDLEIGNEKIARQQLGVDLTTRINSFVASWDHDKFLIYQSIQTVQLDVNNKYASMDLRIKKYEDMLQDITMDSIQITMDSGEINMGAWTILSQAREWDLEILGKFKDYKHDTDQGIDEALKDIQDKLPVVEDIINQAIEQISNAPIIKELDALLGSTIEDVDTVHEALIKEIQDRQNEMVSMAQANADQIARYSTDLAAEIEAETQERVVALQREAQIRQEQLLQEAKDRSAEIDEKIRDINIDVDADLAALNNRVDGVHQDIQDEETARIAAINLLNDGLTQEIQFRKDGDVASIAAVDNYKVSNDQALANVRTDLQANVTATSANTVLIESLASRLVITQGDLADTKTLATSATQKAETALSETTALAQQLVTVNSSIDNLENDLVNKADAAAFNQLSTKVTDIDGKVTTATTDITALKTSVTGLDNTIKGNTSAINKLETVQTVQGGNITQLTTDTTALQNSVELLQDDLATKADAEAFNQLSTKVTQNADTITVQSGDITRLKADLVVADNKINTKANSSALTALDTKVTNIDGKVTTNSSTITSLTGRVTTAEGNINKKADSSAVTSLESKVTQQGLDITSQGASITRIDAAIDATNLAVATKASAAALSTLDSKVTSIDGKVSSNTSAITALTGRVTTTEEALTTKASVYAVNSLTTRITSAEGRIESQTTSITSLNSGLVTTNTKVTAAQTAANNANTLAGGKGKVFFQNAEPAVADRLVQNLWIDTTGNNNTPKRWLTNAWVAVNDKIATDALTAANAANVAIATKADASALSSLDSKVTSINGTVTSQGVSITNLNTRLSSAEGALTTKANSSAVSALDSKVTQQGNTITSQGTDITKLKADLALTNTAVSTKASSEALQSLDNRVVSIDGKVTTNASSITALNGKMTTVENGLATKANGSALSALTTRVSNAEGELSSQSSKVTKLEAGVGNTSTYVISTSRDGSYSEGGLPWGLYNATLTKLAVFSRGFNLVVWANDGSYSSVQRFDTYGSTANIASLATALLALPVNTYFTLVGADNIGTASALQGNVELKNFIIANGGSASYYATWGGTNLPIFTSMVRTGTGTGIQHSFNSNVPNGWIKYPISLISGIPEGFAGVQPIDESKFAAASALSALDSKVTNIDGAVKGHSTQLSNLTASIAGKADTSALNYLTARVEAEEGKSLSQATSITNLNSSVDNALKAVTVSDTRSTNQPPSWYWSNYTRRVVNEFKTQTVIGVGGFFGGTYCNLETKVYYSDPTGGDIIQTATSSVDPSLYVQRRSSGTAGWTAWAQPMKDLRDSLATKASASAVNTLATQVTAIDGKVSANADDLTVLKGTVDNNQSYIINNYYTKADANNATANQITQFKSTLSVGGRNLVRNTALPVTGNDWLFQEKLTRKIQGEVTITWDVEDLSGAPLGGGIGFNMGNGGLGGYEYFDYPIYTTGKHKITKVLDSKTFTHFGFYSNSNCKITNVKVEDGSVPSTWTPAPEDSEIGGRNLLYNSDFRKGLGYWGSYGSPVTVIEANLNNKLTKYAFINGTVGGLYMLAVNIPYSVKAGDIMTLSFYARGNGGMRVGFDAVNKDITIDGTWRRYAVTLRRKEVDSTIMYVNGASYADIALPKLELGDKATDWTPAPEDNIQEIEAQATAVNSLTTQVSNIDDRVSSTASQVLTLESFKSGIQNGEIPGNSIREINLTDPSYGQDTYFPVILSDISTTTRTHLSIVATLDGGAKPSWALHPAGFSANVAWDVTGSGWGTTVPDQVINNAVWNHCVNDVSPIIDVTQDWTSSQPLVWLRGGGRYYYSVPLSRSIAICPAYGTLTSRIGNVYSPRLYDANLIPVSLKQSNEKQTVRLQQTNAVVDGVKAVSTISVDNNGFMSGYGLISQLVNGVVTSAFGINADYFYVGNSNANKKKPFMVLTSPQTIGGVTYPAGTWMDVALIANATIGTAHIQDASITNAKIASLSAEKITAGIISADRIGANSITAEKVTIGTGANLWAQPLFQHYPGFGGRSAQYVYTPELRGWGVQCLGRDHIAPWSTRITVKGGEQYVIEYTAGHNAGPIKSKGVGFWYTDVHGNTVNLAYPAGEVIGYLGYGWYKYRTTITVPESPSLVFAMLFIQIEQSETESNPAHWTVGNVSIRRVNGGELIVNGAITADKLYSNTVSGMFANFGRFESNVAGVGTTVISGPTIEVYDTQRLRVFIGVKP